ncbi:MAG: WbqC family protein [bacterium]
MSDTVICGHQPNFLPYPGFFHKMMNCDQFVFVDNVEFVGRGPFGWIHRNKIKLNNKDEHWLTVPVYQKGRYHQTIDEVEIDNDKPWRKKHWKSIFYNYKDAPYFDRYADEIEAIYDQEWELLVNLSLRFFDFFTDVLNIDVPTVRSSEKNITGESTQLVLNLCNAFDGDRYLSGQHGRDYLDRGLVDKSQVTVLFQDFDCPEYPQLHGDFVPNLSTLDMVMNCGPDSRELIQEAGAITEGWNSEIQSENS